MRLPLVFLAIPAILAAQQPAAQPAPGAAPAPRPPASPYKAFGELTRTCVSCHHVYLRGDVP